MPAMTRICGSCTACCKSLEIVEISKPAGKWCAHCSIGKGCTIYTERPLSCREFRCEWLKGFGEENERPDKTKVILDFVRVPGGPPEGQFQMWEVSEGALGQQRIRKLITWALEKEIWVFHVPLHGPPKVFIPPTHEVPEKTLRDLEEKGMKVAS